MNHASATLNINAGAQSGSGSKRAFARHFGEMVLAMFLGMVVLGGLAELVFAVSGSSLADQPGGTQVMLMGFNMTVPMVLWMSYRGHAAARNVEMALSMSGSPRLGRSARVWGGARRPARGHDPRDAGCDALALPGLLTPPRVAVDPSRRSDESPRSPGEASNRPQRLRRAIGRPGAPAPDSPVACAV
jgi:hypothetical protein